MHRRDKLDYTEKTVTGKDIFKMLFPENKFLPIDLIISFNTELCAFSFYSLILIIYPSGENENSSWKYGCYPFSFGYLNIGAYFGNA